MWKWDQLQMSRDKYFHLVKINGFLYAWIHNLSFSKDNTGNDICPARDGRLPKYALKSFIAQCATWSACFYRYWSAIISYLYDFDILLCSSKYTIHTYISKLCTYSNYSFEALKIPYDWKIISKTKHRLNLNILKNILMQNCLVISEKIPPDVMV